MDWAWGWVGGAARLLLLGCSAAAVPCLFGFGLGAGSKVGEMGGGRAARPPSYPTLPIVQDQLRDVARNAATGRGVSQELRSGMLTCMALRGKGGRNMLGDARTI